MLDEALLRPGRLEVQVEIGLPDEHGRVQILQVGGVRGSMAGWLAAAPPQPLCMPAARPSPLAHTHCSTPPPRDTTRSTRLA